MKKLLAFGALLALATAPPSFAQTTSSAAQSGSASQAGAQAITGSAAIVQQTFTGPQRQESAVTYGGRFQNDQNVTYNGGYRQDYRATIRNTPDAYAPAITGGTNPCTNGVSGGGSVAGFGLALGGSWSDPNCERRNLSALLHNQGQQALAQEVLCETDTVRQARLRMGTPCIADVQRANAAGPVQQIVTPAQTTARAPAPARDWCDTVGPADNREVRQTCGWTGRNFTQRPNR